MRYLPCLFLLAFLTGCHKDGVDSSDSPSTCLGANLVRTGKFINQDSATIVAFTVSNQQTIYQIAWKGSPVSMSPCNLPTAFQKDSLKITLSGYFVRSPGASLVDISNLPFEITEIKQRD